MCPRNVTISMPVPPSMFRTTSIGNSALTGVTNRLQGKADVCAQENKRHPIFEPNRGKQLENRSATFPHLHISNDDPDCPGRRKNPEHCQHREKQLAPHAQAWRRVCG